MINLNFGFFLFAHLPFACNLVLNKPVRCSVVFMSSQVLSFDQLSLETRHQKFSVSIFKEEYSYNYVHEGISRATGFCSVHNGINSDVLDSNHNIL